MMDTTSENFFEALYQRDADPWGFRTSEYEQSRYDTILRSLAGERFHHGFEPGCSIGALTVRLATMCDRLDAMDLSATAVQRAQQLCTAPNVRIMHGSLATSIPEGMFDLIVLSEIGYYFSEEVLLGIGHRLIHQMLPGCVLLAAHWLGVSADHCLSGDRVHEILGSLPQLRHTAAQRHNGFRLDRWSRA